MIQNCLNSLLEICLECQPFYKLSYNKKYCFPICNDGIVVENETCDDQNNIQFDGCYQCQLSCQLECSQCIQQQCYSCIDGWQIIDYRCYQICGDGYLAISSIEQCDEGNYQPYDGCYDCNFQCEQNCLYCDGSNICLECQENFEKNDQNHCKPICGDGIIIKGLEDCDDLNDIQYDGCYQCVFQCSQNCSKCKQGKCQECAEGYDLIVNECRYIIIINANQTDDNKAVQVNNVETKFNLLMSNVMMEINLAVMDVLSTAKQKKTGNVIKSSLISAYINQIFLKIRKSNL